MMNPSDNDSSGNNTPPRPPSPPIDLSCNEYTHPHPHPDCMSCDDDVVMHCGRDVYSEIKQTVATEAPVQFESSTMLPPPPM